MKFDIELVKDILERCEAECDGDLINFDNDDFSEEEFKKYAYHFKILNNEGFIDGRHDAVSGHKANRSIMARGLTLSGYHLLDALRADNVWDKIKSNLGEIGVASLKQIPALAINIALKMM